VARHLLVTNDFPPKVGGIQSYLWELWRRLPADEVVVHTTPYEGTEEWDAAQDFTVVRSREPWLLPQPVLVRRVNQLIREHEADLVILDPAVPVGLIGPSLDVPYGVVLHGAEVTIPGRLPVSRQLMNRVLNGAVGVISAGGYAAAEAERSVGHSLPITVVPPGVDVSRITPLDAAGRIAARERLGLPSDGPLVTSASRLVPRKGMDVLIRASEHVQRRHPDVHVAISGSGRDTKRLQGLVDELGAPVTMLGRLPDESMPDLYACGDVFSVLCRTRWGGLEQEGFGIIFVEAAAAGVAQVAGRSGGAHEAVAHEETGLIVDDPTDDAAVADAISELLDDPHRRAEMAVASRARVEQEFDYDRLAERLHVAITEMSP
jgi:phosphatidylinositol alpha-1,6-mannosyltransferase